MVALMGIETAKVETDGELKADLTLIETITALGANLPLFLVAKVRTLHCQKQFAADVAN
jgi:hypothetical protein